MAAIEQLRLGTACVGARTVDTLNVEVEDKSSDDGGGDDDDGTYTLLLFWTFELMDVGLWLRRRYTQFIVLVMAARAAAA